MTAPYETVCPCGRIILRSPQLHIRPERCESCEREANEAAAQLSLFACGPALGRFDGDRSDLPRRTGTEPLS